MPTRKSSGRFGDTMNSARTNPCCLGCASRSIRFGRGYSRSSRCSSKAMIRCVASCSPGGTHSSAKPGLVIPDLVAREYYADRCWPDSQRLKVFQQLLDFGGIEQYTITALFRADAGAIFVARVEVAGQGGIEFERAGRFGGIQAHVLGVELSAADPKCFRPLAQRLEQIAKRGDRAVV